MIKGIIGSRKLKLELDGGMSGDKEIRKSKTFSNVNLESEVEEIYEVGKALGGLQSFDLLNIKKLEEVILIEE